MKRRRGQWRRFTSLILPVSSQVLPSKSSPRAERSVDEYAFCRNFAHKTVYLIRVFTGTLDSRFSSGEGLAVCRTCTSEQASSRRSARMIYDRSYPKSGYWNFNIRYNRPILPRTLSQPPTLPPPSPIAAPVSPTLVCDLPSSLDPPRVHVLLFHVRVESRTPLIQGFFRPSTTSAGRVDKSFT